MNGNFLRLFLVKLELLYQISSSLSDKSTTACFDYEHCNTSQGGVHDLECFKIYSGKKLICEWKPGIHVSNSTKYTLIIEQKERNRCEKLTNITGTTYNSDIFSQFNFTVWVVEVNEQPSVCFRDVFLRGRLVRCPPEQIKYERQKDDFIVTWKKKKNVHYQLQYKELNKESWILVNSKVDDRIKVAVPNETAFYEAQIKCIPNDVCNDCKWSESLFIPPGKSI
ncbi:uncharacterized protein LOC120532562 [Polypterus senegalus]|uniref:uncharacterized protein LOC120532562 n=1 Tax=Polypterus senegalus TaxID=55291 RepID=UPI001965F379|nr:uncharacterized protein LOC120532562 [Polypterus senegalus]